ncbi:hypothetical protein ABFS82_11G032700 [Erythranthe guttata]
MQLNMDKRFFGLLILLFLFAGEMMMNSEATRMCKSRSREYVGKRCYNRNCHLICLHEKFTYGRCSRAQKCQCYKPCEEPLNPGQEPPPAGPVSFKSPAILE